MIQSVAGRDGIDGYLETIRPRTRHEEEEQFDARTEKKKKKNVNGFALQWVSIIDSSSAAVHHNTMESVYSLLFEVRTHTSVAGRGVWHILLSLKWFVSR